MSLKFPIERSILLCKCSPYHSGDLCTSCEVEFKFRLAWALGSAYASSWVAVPINGGISFTVGSFVYNQTATSNTENWEQGEGTFIYNFPSTGPYSISFASGNWIDLAYGYGGNWNIETIVDLHRRSDTQYPNYSPITTSRAIYRVQFGCPVSIQIPMVDTDGDNVKCRWATQAEASSIYKLLPNAIIDENKCIITFTADAANNYISGGWYAVAITIEDFPRKNITINGQVYTPTTPITQIPLQFLVKTETISGECDQKPTFVPSSPPEGSVKQLRSTATLFVDFYVHSNVSLNYIDINGPLGLTKSSIKPDDHGRSNIWFVNVFWTPREAGTNIICTTAEDTNRKLSETRCFTVLVSDVDECKSSPCLHNGTCINLLNSYSCQCAEGWVGVNCQSWLNHCYSSPCLNGGHCHSKYEAFTCDCPDQWHGYRCEYRIADKTDVCKYLEYTECSCVTSKLGQVERKSYTVLISVISPISGLLGSIIPYIIWQLLSWLKGRKPNKVDSVHLEESTSVKLIEPTPNDSTDTLKEETTVESHGPIHCNCFVDHTGYDHFQRYDPLDNRFRFHNCRHKNINHEVNHSLKSKLSSAS